MKFGLSQSCEAGSWFNDFSEWDIGFNGVVLSDEDALFFEEMLLLLHKVKLKPYEKYRFVWWRQKDGFLVKDCYKRICEYYLVVPTSDPLKAKAVDCLWKSKVLSKIFIFGRRLILIKLSTRMELARHEIIEGAHNVVCLLYFLEKEDVDHLFCSCLISNFSWNNFLVWIGVDTSSPGDSLLVRLQYLNSPSLY